MTTIGLLPPILSVYDLIVPVYQSGLLGDVAVAAEDETVKIRYSDEEVPTQKQAAGKKGNGHGKRKRTP